MMANPKKSENRKIYLRLSVLVLSLGLISFVLINYVSYGTMIQGSTEYPALNESEYVISENWTVTAYQSVDELLYHDPKTEVFDVNGNSLGYYKKDFLEQVKVDGSGIGDGHGNPGGYINYDFEVNDGITYYLTQSSLGAYNNELHSWSEDRPSVAVNPPLPQGTEIRFLDLGPDASYNPAWVNDRLKTKTFYSDDKFFGYSFYEKKIDIYVGNQKTVGGSSPENFLMHDVKVAIKLHENDQVQ